MGARRFLLLKADIDREDGAGRAPARGFPKRPERRGREYRAAWKCAAWGAYLHDFYSGIERVFGRIAVELDGELPRGDRLEQPTPEPDGGRMSRAFCPRVLTPDLAERLRPFLRFRHRFRNLGGGQLHWERSTELLAEADEVWPLFQQQMEGFKGVLGQLHDGCQ